MPKEKRSNLLKGLGISLGVIAVVAGATAVVTKGFTNWGAAERIVMGGNVVKKFVVDSLAAGDAVFVDTVDEDISFNANFSEGGIDINEKAILGDGTTAGALAAADFETALAGFEVGLTKVGELEEYVMDPETDLAKVSTLTVNLYVEYDEDNLAYLTDTIEVPYFNAIRFNYKIQAERLITVSNTDNAGEAEDPTFSYKKRINTITPLYENVDLIAADDVTLFQNEIVFSSYSKLGVVDNKVEIVSIEFIDTVGGHDNESCWISQTVAE